MKWALEQLFVCQGIKRGLGDFRWIKTHDLCVFQNLLGQDEEVLKDLKPFNFGRSIHYNHDKQNNLIIIKNLLKSINLSKANKVNKKFDQYWNKIFSIGLQLIKVLTEKTVI